MASLKRNIRSILTLAGIVSALISQTVWLYDSYRMTGRQLMLEAKDSFEPAYKKEQTYRVPLVSIINSGAVTIESCGTEEVLIIRYCPEPDTIKYNNVSGLSLESFINRFFVDIRELVTPININCLADLYSGMLFDKNIQVNFVVERFNTITGEVLNSSYLPDKKHPKMNPETTILMDISETESLRAVLEIPATVILRRMAGSIVLFTLLTMGIIGCLCYLYFGRSRHTDSINIDSSVTSDADSSVTPTENITDFSFTIGQYTYSPGKNELYGFEKATLLNKKENTILYMLCCQKGNVVERNALLEANWGKNGIIYSRSLDTYITSLRKYLKNDPSVQIVTIKGVGYKLTLPL